MAAVATVICTALVAPVFTTPVYAGNSSFVWEDEEPFVVALWGKYSKYDGKLVYRLANVKNEDFYTESVEEIKAYGFKVIGEYMNERGETYYKFVYVGNQKLLAAPQTGNTYEPPIIEETDKPTHTEETEIPIEPDAPTHTEETEIVEEELIPADTFEITEIIELIPVETVETIEVVEEYIPVETVETIEIVGDVITFDSVENNEVVEQAAIMEEKLIAAPLVGTNKPFEGTENCTVGHCSDAKEIIWEKNIETDEEPETETITVPGTTITIPWHEELLHNPANNVGSTAGKEDIWEFEKPSINFLGCKIGACYQVQLSENFSFRTESIDWIFECGFKITGEKTNKNGVVVYEFEYVK